MWKGSHPLTSMVLFLTLTWLLNKVVGDLWERYLQLLDEGIPDG